MKMLSNIEKNQLGQIYAATCKAYDKTLESDVLKMQIEDLADLSFDQIAAALMSYRRDEKNTQWPRASKIRAIVNPVQSPDTMANEVASRVRSAIPMFGWPNPQEARAYIGELGWAIVERNGGWQYLCENLGVELSQLTFHAQARDLAKAMIESEKLGLGNMPISLPAPAEKIQIEKLNNLSNCYGVLDYDKENGDKQTDKGTILIRLFIFSSRLYKRILKRGFRRGFDESMGRTGQPFWTSNLYTPSRLSKALCQCLLP